VDPAAGFDDPDRCLVGGIAGEENAFDAEASGDRNAVVKDGSTVAVPAVGLQHGVADVPAPAGKARVECVPDTRSPHDFVIEDGEEKCLRDDISRQVSTLPSVVQPLKVLPPSHGWIKAEREVEAVVVAHPAMCRPDCLLVAGLHRPQSQSVGDVQWIGAMFHGATVGA
jgi:hypothetical protein